MDSVPLNSLWRLILSLLAGNAVLPEQMHGNPAAEKLPFALHQVFPVRREQGELLAKLRQFPLDPYLGKLTTTEADVAIYSFITKYKICHKRSKCQVGQNFITTHTSNNGDVFSEVLILGQVHLQDPGSYYTPIYAKVCSCMHLSLSESIAYSSLTTVLL